MGFSPLLRCKLTYPCPSLITKLFIQKWANSNYLYLTSKLYLARLNFCPRVYFCLYLHTVERSCIWKENKMRSIKWSVSLCNQYSLVKWEFWGSIWYLLVVLFNFNKYFSLLQLFAFLVCFLFLFFIGNIASKVLKLPVLH